MCYSTSKITTYYLTSSSSRRLSYCSSPIQPVTDEFIPATPKAPYHSSLFERFFILRVFLRHSFERRVAPRAIWIIMWMSRVVGLSIAIINSNKPGSYWWVTVRIIIITMHSQTIWLEAVNKNTPLTDDEDVEIENSNRSEDHTIVIIKTWSQATTQNAVQQGKGTKGTA